MTALQAGPMSRADVLLAVGTASFGAAALVMTAPGPAHADSAAPPSNGINVGKIIGNEGEAVAIIRKHWSLLYLATGEHIRTGMRVR